LFSEQPFFETLSLFKWIKKAFIKISMINLIDLTIQYQKDTIERLHIKSGEYVKAKHNKTHTTAIPHHN